MLNEQKINQTNIILTKVNEVIKNVNFTALKPVNKTYGHCFLICAGNNFDLYGSYASEKYFVSYNGQFYLLA
jgi:hypothetical protein